MFRWLLFLVALGAFPGCAGNPGAPRLQRFAGQWELGVAASYFWTTDGRAFGLYANDTPRSMADFHDKQPRLHDEYETVAYYEVFGWLVPDHVGAPGSGVDYHLHIERVLRMEPMRRDLPPLALPHS